MQKVLDYTKSIVWNRYALIVLVLLASGLWVWRAWLSPTYIGLVNYREFLYAEIADIEDLSPFVRVSRISTDELTNERLSRYAVLLVRGRGLNLSPAQQEAMVQASKNGTRIHVYASTGDTGDIPTLDTADYEAVEAYMRNGGRRNMRSLFHYVRRHLDGKRFLAGHIDPPREIPDDMLYHKGNDAIFGSVEEYQSFYEEIGAYSPEAPRVAFITTVVGHHSVGHGYTDAIIDAFESRNINIYPISASGKRLDFLREIDPHLIVYVPHGRLGRGRTQETLAWLEEQDVPLLTPVDVFSPYDEWVQSQEGSAGPPMGQGIVTPELDGGIEPYAISAQFLNEDGLHVFRGIPQRIETFADRVERWLTLQQKPNKDKRLAIVYFRGPGANAMVAGGLEVAPSLFNMLQHLEQEGFDTGNLPDTEEAFWEVIQEKGAVIAPYAQGAFEDFLDSGDPAMVAAETYLEWVQQHLEPEMYSTVEDRYGPAPGQYLATQRDERPYLAIPRIEFGNIALMPQLLPAVGDDEVGMIHGADQAPPHPYIAQYLWAREGFRADALVHFGTHGSLEFTPWRQVALSQYDWPDALVGDLPHSYVYVINNVGEAMLAKRRTYAVINSHLTPPFMESDLHGAFAALHDSIHDYMMVEDGAVRQAYAEQIVELVKESGVADDLRLDDLSAETFDRDLFNRIHNYVHEIEHEQITEGLYTLGEAYTEEQIMDTVRQIAINPLSYSMARLDILEGVQDEGILEDLHNFEIEYRDPAMEMIDALLAGEAEPGDFLSAEHEKVVADRMASEHTGGEDSGERPAGMPEGLQQPETEGPDPMVLEILEHGVEDGPAADLLLAMDEDALTSEAETWNIDRIRTFLRHLSAFMENREMADALEAHEEDHEEQGMDAVAAILQSDVAMEQITTVANRMEQRLAQAVEYERLVTTLVETLYGVREYYEAIEASPQRELDSVVAALSGRYIAPSPGGDPIATPNSVPTGRNLYSIDPARTPSEAAWSVGKDLAEQLIESQVARNGGFPQRTAMTFWGGEFIRSQGINVAQALYLMGVRPVWNSQGVAHDVELIPSDELNRPRIDVVVQTSGQFRDIAECRVHLLDRAVQLANEAPADPEFANYVREGTASAEQALREQGMSPLEARNFASARVFGGAGGRYGPDIGGLVESGDQWEDESEIAELYLQNMGAIYTRDHWGHYAPGLFEASLQNTDTVVQPRSSNTWGPLSLDHVYEFTGGINAAIRHVTGEDPSAYFNDLRNQHNARVQGAEEAISVEARSTILNPRYIEGLQAGGASSAEVFAETFRNTYGWNVMKPDAIQESMWEDYYDVYIEDALDLNMQEYFEDINPYALQEMTAVMLETIRKEYWDADQATIENLSNLHASLVEDHEAGCSGFVCDNAQLREFIAEHVDMPETAEAYMASIESVRTGEVAEAVEGMRLEPERQTMEVVRELVSENMAMMIVVLVLVAAFSGAVYYGAMRRTA